MRRIATDSPKDFALLFLLSWHRDRRFFCLSKLMFLIVSQDRNDRLAQMLEFCILVALESWRWYVFLIIRRICVDSGTNISELCIS